MPAALEVAVTCTHCQAPMTVEPHTIKFPYGVPLDNGAPDPDPAILEAHCTRLECPACGALRLEGVQAGQEKAVNDYLWSQCG